MKLMLILLLALSGCNLSDVHVHIDELCQGPLTVCTKDSAVPEPVKAPQK